MQRELVERARSGDLDAFSQLVKASFPRLFGVAHLILHDADAAQDATQDAFLSAWQHLRALRDPDAWDAWLRRLVVRACYKVARKEKRRSLVERHSMPEPATASVPDISTEIAERDRLGRELRRLGIEQRTVIVLHYYIDLPLPEVAENFEIPVGTAASRLHRGLDAMRARVRAGSDLELAQAGERPA